MSPVSTPPEAQSSPAAAPSSWRGALLPTALLAALTLIALALRLPYMTRSFWFDEVFTANLATFSWTPGRLIEYLLTDDVHPPLHYFLMQWWSTLLDLHAWPTLTAGIEWKLRLPSLLAGLASVPLAYLVGQRFTPLAGWAAAVTVALSPLTIGESVEARMYASLTFLNLAGWLVLLRARPGTASRRSLWLAGLIGAVGIWQQVLFGFMIAAQALYLAFRPTRPATDAQDSTAQPLTSLRQRVLDLVALTALPATILIWLPNTINSIRKGGANTAIRVDPAQGARVLADIWTGQHPLMILAAFALVILGLLWAMRRQQLATVISVTLGGTLLWLLSSLALNTVSIRYGGMFTPGIGLLLGLGLSALITDLRLPARSVTLAGLATLSVIPLMSSPQNRVVSEPWRELAQYLGPRMRDGDHLATTESGRLLSLLYYLRTDATFDNRTVDGNTTSQLDQGRVWLVLNFFGGNLRVPAEKTLVDYLVRRFEDRTARRVIEEPGTTLVYIDNPDQP